MPHQPTRSAIQFDGRCILLPDEPRYYPKDTALRWGARQSARAGGTGKKAGTRNTRQILNTGSRLDNGQNSDQWDVVSPTK